MTALEDCMVFLQQLRDSYTDNEEELDAARRINLLHEEIAQMCDQDEERITDIIRGMQEEVREAEAAATPPDPELHVRQVADLEAACRESRTHITSMENEARDLQEQQQELKQRRHAAEERGANAARQLRQADPKLRNELSLYAHISRIAWKYGGTHVAGTVSDRERKDLRPFDFDPATLSEFQLVNKLWEVIA